MDQAGNALGQYGNTDTYGGGTNRVKDSGGSPIACPEDEESNDGDNNDQQPAEGVTDPGIIVLPPTAAERIELAMTTTSIPTLMALVPLHPVAVAKNPICPATVLTQLHTSSRKWVRYWVARHRSTTTEVLNTLANDSDSEVAQAAKNNLNSR